MKGVASKYILEKLIIVLLLISIMFSHTPLMCLAAEQENSPQIMVSLGDSYSSGEGIEPFYGQDEDNSKKVKNPDWLAHRSQLAWSGLLTLPSNEGKMSDDSNRGKYWFFVAASGAVTDNLLGEFNKEYKKGKYSGDYQLPPQLDVFDQIGENKADYVTMTLGGNDAGFSDIITTCVTGSTHLNFGGLTDKLNNTWKDYFKDGGIRDKLYKAYNDVADKAGSQAKIIVAGYPKLLSREGGFMISKEEAALVNENVSKFNNAIEGIIQSCRGNGININFVSVEEAFDGHEAYTDSPYINEVILLARSQDLKDFLVASAYSMHPNKMGAQAYAKCVQAKINELENVQTAGIYDTNFSLIAYDANDNICGNYVIDINGEEFLGPFKLGLFKKEYSKTIKVENPKKIKISLPKGDYTITICDSSDESKEYRKDVKIRPNTKKNELIYRTNFGEEKKEVDDNTSNNNEKVALIPEGAVEYNGHYYYLYSGGIASTYDEAAQYCGSKGGYLATLTSEAENDFVYSYITQQGCESAYFGLSDAIREGNWEWCTGEPFSYSNWHVGEPNGENSYEDYALLYYKYTDGTWNDGDFGDSTVGGGNAFICEWGDYSLEQHEVSGERNIVLTLDVSGSMSGTPLEETKKASSKFINTVLEQDASIGIVTYDNESYIASNFSTDKTSLQSIVSGLYDGGGTNIEAGLRDAQSMLEKTNAKKKIIVLMSDGEPNDGLIDEELIAYAEEIKKTGTIIYTIGFFESLSDRSYAQYLMEQIASDGCHYEVADADQLTFFFEDMADQINGQKYIYVRIACPVDVSVSYDGETLDSSEKNLNARTSFGTLTFEENSEKLEAGIDDRVKVLRLKEGTDYDLKIVGTGHGIMNYSIGFMDENGEYSDLRKFKNIKITRKTRIDTEASNSDSSILNIDEDGDGKYDIRLKAEANGYGEEITTSNWIIYVIIGAVAFVMLDIIAIVIYTKMKKRRGE